MSKRLGVKWREAHQTMHPRLILKCAVNTFTIYFQSDIPIPAMIIFVFMNYSIIPLSLIKKFLIHFKKHAGKILGVISSRAGKNSHHGPASVVFPHSRQFIFQRLVFTNQRLSLVFIRPKFRRVHSPLNFFDFLLNLFFTHEPEARFELATYPLRRGYSTN